jgi:hypothetical protein
MISPSGSQPLAGLSAALGLAALWAYFVCFSYYQLVILFIIMVYLTVALASQRLGFSCLSGGHPQPSDSNLVNFGESHGQADHIKK